MGQHFWPVPLSVVCYRALFKLNTYFYAGEEGENSTWNAHYKKTQTTFDLFCGRKIICIFCFYVISSEKGMGQINFSILFIKNVILRQIKLSPNSDLSTMKHFPFWDRLHKEVKCYSWVSWGWFLISEFLNLY